MTHFQGPAKMFLQVNLIQCMFSYQKLARNKKRRPKDLCFHIILNTNINTSVCIVHFCSLPHDFIQFSFIYLFMYKNSLFALSVGGLVSPLSLGPLPETWEPEGPAQDLSCSYDCALLD